MSKVNMKKSSIDLPPSIRNPLSRAGIITIKQLAECTDEELRQIKGISDKRLQIIREFLAKKQASLKPLGQLKELPKDLSETLAREHPAFVNATRNVAEVILTYLEKNKPNRLTDETYGVLAAISVTCPDLSNRIASVIPNDRSEIGAFCDNVDIMLTLLQYPEDPE